MGLYLATKNRISAVLVDSCARALPPPAVGSATISQRPGPPSPATPNSKSFGGSPCVSLSNVTTWAGAASPVASHAAAARTHNHRLVSLIGPIARHSTCLFGCSLGSGTENEASGLDSSRRLSAPGCLQDSQGSARAPAGSRSCRSSPCHRAYGSSHRRRESDVHDPKRPSG